MTGNQRHVKHKYHHRSHMCQKRPPTEKPHQTFFFLGGRLAKELLQPPTLHPF